MKWDTFLPVLNLLSGIFSRLETKVDRLIRSIDLLSINTRLMATDLTNLQAAVAKNGDVIQSALTLIAGFKAQLDTAGTDPAALKALSDSLGTQDKALADAVAQNTPVAVTPPTPAPTPAPAPAPA